MTEKTLLLQLRDAAKVEVDELIRYNLRLIADELDSAVSAFTRDPSEAGLRAINGHWAHGMRMLDFAGKRPRPGGSGGALKEGAQLAA